MKNIFNMYSISKKLIRILFLLLVIFFQGIHVSGQNPNPFSSIPLEEEGDLSALMVAGIDSFLLKETERIRQARGEEWQPDFSSFIAFENSISRQRELLENRTGVVENRVMPKMEVMSDNDLQLFKLETDAIVISAVRWNVLDGLSAEGLLLQPKGKTTAKVIMIPDADVLPETLAGLMKSGGPRYGTARRLAESGCEVLIPVLVNRDDTFSGSQLLDLYTNQPHREWIYRQGYVVGRHVIGYELQKIFAAIDWMKLKNEEKRNDVQIGVCGYGEGGLLSLYASAIDPRITSTLVSGYFNAREQVWEEPIYRNVFGLLKYFGDAELAVMTWPRSLVIEHSIAPEIPGPPMASKDRKGAAPGILMAINYSTAEAEVNRAKAMVPRNNNHINWIHDDEGGALKPFSYDALSTFTNKLNVDLSNNLNVLQSPLENTNWIDTNQRQKRTVLGMQEHVQKVLRLCEITRDQNFWEVLENGTDSIVQLKSMFREQFSNQIGYLKQPFIPMNPRSRILEETEDWTSYKIKLDVWEDVFTWGILIIPKSLKLGEKYPVVVCQHGLEGLPIDIVSNDSLAQKFGAYQGLATKLAERGYITFSPNNPYIGGDKFRVLQRKANPLGLSLFSIIVGQHQRIVEWLGQQNFIDSSRIGFYGLSYGGKTAMRIPILVKGYAFSICSGDFNDWVRKNVSIRFRYSYMFTGEYEIPEWDLGHTFNYAEMAGLIAPRPFMVERGHFDLVAKDEWVGYEFAKVRRHYDLIGKKENCRIEYFNGEHMINGVGTFEFIDQFFLEKGSE